MRSLKSITVLLLAGSTLLAQPAAAASWLEMNFGLLRGPGYDGNVPTCDWGLGTISSRFSQKESRFWASDAVIDDYADVREVAYRPWGDKVIPRRYCEAKALVSSASFGKQVWTKVYYSIGEDTGFAGFTWGVNWCVVGADRNLAYAPDCKQARP
ncbi:MAG: hypothetical protein KF826_07840 [Xanthobacteraceae bacterium]|nr:hypothetical protein [Xanthobacteraceae bacterium]MBX3523048.1 hypothetical protein [Xanthobacteraceae bacterium]MBX3534248.1 hypothetical protein [Xanthobacteraceae bacterium]MBX3549175.1 hypothetical protein [Xanthobacteraceae bacterium]MCW5675257.1 hypothetical protein [Xanthobacteraceae bacterium]